MASGIGLAIIGVPLVIPLSALVFLAAFVPILAGTVAVLVALVAKEFIAAIIVLAVVQLETISCRCCSAAPYDCTPSPSCSPSPPG